MVSIPQGKDRKKGVCKEKVVLSYVCGDHYKII